MNPKLLIWLSSIGIVFAALFGAYSYGRHVEHLKQDNIRLDAVEKQRIKNEKVLQDYIKDLTEATNENAKHQVTIRDLAAKSRRVRVSFTACPLPGDTQAPTNTDAGAGALSESVDNIFGAFQERITVLIETCDALNAEAIRNNALAAGLR